MKNLIYFIVLLVLLASCSQLEQAGIDIASPNIEFTQEVLGFLPHQTKNDAIASLKIALLNNKNTYIIDSLGFNASGTQGGVVIFGARQDSCYSQIGTDSKRGFTGLVGRSPKPVILSLNKYFYVLSLTIDNFPNDNRFVHFWSGKRYSRLDGSQVLFLDDNTLICEVPAFVRSEFDRVGWICISFGSNK